MRILNVGTKNECGLCLGMRGENRAEAIVFDISYLIENYGQGAAILLAKRETDESPYPASDVTQSGSALTWILTDIDTGIAGQGEAELFWYVNGDRAKSLVYRTWTLRDIINTPGQAPDPIETWIETLTDLGAETLENAQNAHAAQDAAEEAQRKAEEAQQAAEDAESGAEQARENVEAFALKSEGYAVGTQDGTAVPAESPYYDNNAKYYSEQAGVSKTDAQAAKTDAQGAALKSEGYAVGTQDGAAVPAESPYYDNNAKYYSEQAWQAVESLDLGLSVVDGEINITYEEVI